MLSRAHLLIEKEYTKFNKDPPWGIDAIPLTDTNIFEWGAKIQGPRDTIWDGGVFRLYIRFDENFNQRPPQICFHTIPFHPNVDMITGAPCLEIIDDWEKWRESFSISMVLLSIQMMLSNPVLDAAVNTSAAELIERSPRAYRQMVLDCVTASQRVEAGLSAELSESVSSEKIQCVPIPDKPPPKPATPVSIKVSQLSFENYHNTWRGIATSKTQPSSKNTIIETMKDTTVLRNNHIRMTDQEIEEQLSRQLEEHNGLIYGRFRAKKTAQEDRAAKLEKIDKMKKIYLPPRKPNCTPVQDGTGSRIGGGRDEAFEGEVDDLIAWSAKLNTDLIDV